MKLISKLPAWLKNKYLIASAAFLAVMLFLDKNDFFTRMDRNKELRKLEQSKAYYQKELAAERKELEALRTNPATLEKYARENHYMKRDGEDLFIIPENHDPAKN